MYLYVKKADLLESVKKIQKKIHFKSQKSKFSHFFVKIIDEKDPYVSNFELLCVCNFRFMFKTLLKNISI